MKAVRFHQVGGPETLVYEDVPDAVAGPGQVLIRVEAVGLNFADVIRRRGHAYPEPSPTPFTLGIEVAGTVAALGEGVTGFEIGASVMATPGAGGYAQFIAVPAALVVPLPPGVPAVLAAAVVAHGASASIALRHAAKLQPGETVLIEGAAGGLGTFAVQLAKLMGAKVIAAASTPEKRALAEKLGADASVDYTKPDWVQQVRDLTNGRGVDVVLETAGGKMVDQALQALAPFGRMVFIGQSSGEGAQIDPWSLTERNITVTGFYVNGFAQLPGLLQATMEELMGFIMTGKLVPQVGHVLPLAQAAEAHRLLENRQTSGKVVLQPWA